MLSRDVVSVLDIKYSSVIALTDGTIMYLPVVEPEPPQPAAYPG